MDPRLAQPSEIIAAHLRQWGAEPAWVELALFGSDDARAIAIEIDGFCRRELKAGVARGLFHQSSVGSVSGVELDDGRRVVLKGHAPERSLEWLREVVRVQMHLASRRRYVTTVVAGPAPLGRGLALVEPFVDEGETIDAHAPAIRRALARALHDLVVAGQPLAATSTLPGPRSACLPSGRLWPTPHSRLFDFDATADGAGFIDAVAVAARARLAPAGDLVIGHGDWRAEHVRFASATDARPVAAFDWDSLRREHEPALVGFTAHALCADWTRAPRMAPAPTLAEARAFVADWEEARGRRFSVDERRLCGASFAYWCAYTARCGWAQHHDQRHQPGSFHHLLALEGARLLEL